MEVTKSNFKELRPQIEEAIQSSSFLSIDGEFTGLNNGNSISPFDTPAQYYDKLLSGSLDFLFVQFGLSIFTHISDFKYDNKTYIFYLFPDPINRDMRFLCQTSSLSFLSSHGFDFNKLFREGIPYLKHRDEATLREVLDTKKKQSEANSVNQNHIDVPAAQKPFVDSAMNAIKVLLEPGKEKEEVKVDNCSAFVRKLVYQTVREELAESGISLETIKGVLIAKRSLGGEDIEKMKKQAADREEDEIQTSIGFVNIIKSIVNSGKLIVGHNMLLDICHVVHHFVDSLPLNYPKFKEMVHSLFPKILDTKYFLSADAMKDLFPSTYLPSVLETVSKSPFELPDLDSEENLSFQLNSDKFHNSGYDAFITGVCFLSSLRYLESSEKLPHDINSPLLKDIVNKLYLMRIPDTCIHLGGNDPNPPRNHVFHVALPKTWTNQNLQELFSPFGTIRINWVDDNTAWVSLHNRKESERAKQLLEGAKKLPGVLVSSYGAYQASFGSQPVSPVVNKRAGSADADSGVVDSKKRRQSAPKHGKTKICEEPEVKNGKATIASLESAASSSSTKTFPVDEDWG